MLESGPNRFRFAQEFMEIFRFYFADFADFEDFNWLALQEGAVCSWSLYGMNYRIDRAIEFRRDRFRFTQDSWRYSGFSFPFGRFC